MGEDGKLIIEEPDTGKGDSDEEPGEKRGRKGSKRSLGSDDETTPGQVATVRDELSIESKRNETELN